MNLKHILFDFDGTIIDSAPCILNCYEQVMSDLNITPSVPITASIIGPPLTDTVAMLANTEDEVLIENMATAFKSFYDSRVATETPMYAEIEEVLAWLNEQRYQLYIATNKRYEPTMAVIEHLSLAKYFTDIGAVDQLPLGKQKKSLLIQRLVKEHNIEEKEALYIGDKLDDYQAATFNSMPFVAAGWGYGDWESSNTVFHSPLQLLHFISNYNG
ncbi:MULTISPECIES: HAD family hydrolase [unclassified Methylophaga]|jgi:phosphoglycolate phosphatase|uniref:HAD family hydrolase n=1 Tax=unclassified Methylophaga TaxID=2629249 RepID=UPI00259CF2EC|nr:MULTISPECIES: HAD family hydrolase [unclassified Methylophaga]|tara:strand:+ start:5279 stop:5923 length:645 start_codon:yes stop_codon:yes gene_type:complete